MGSLPLRTDTAVGPSAAGVGTCENNPSPDSVTSRSRTSSSSRLRIETKRSEPVSCPLKVSGSLFLPLVLVFTWIPNCGLKDETCWKRCIYARFNLINLIKFSQQRLDLPLLPVPPDLVDGSLTGSASSSSR